MKKHGFRSIFSLLLAVMMVCSMLPTAAFAEGNVEEQKSVVVETYTVTYTDGMGGAAFAEQKTEGLLYGDPTPAFAGDPALDGYTFTGWDKEIAETVTESVTYTAQWQAVPAESQAEAAKESAATLTGEQGTNNEAVTYELNTGHKIDVTFTILYVGDEFGIGYNYGSSEKTQFVCQYSEPHSDTAYANHTIAISDIKAAAGRASVNSGYQIVGWAKDANANPTVWSLDKSGTTACNKGTTIYLVAKNPNPTTKYTYVLKYDANGGTGAPGDDSWSTTDAAIRYHFFTVTSTVPTLAGYTFKGWKAKDGSDTIYHSDNTKGVTTCSVSQQGNDVTQSGNTWTRTLYAVWEKKAPNVPSDEEIKKALEGNVSVVVRCVTANSGHSPESYQLSVYVSSLTKPNPNEVTANSDGTYSYTVSFLASNFVKLYGSGVGTEHTLADGIEKREVKLTWKDSTTGWTAMTQSVYVDAKCETVTIPGPAADEFDDLPIQIKCDTKTDGSHDLKLSYKDGTYKFVRRTDPQYGYVVFTPSTYLDTYNKTYPGHTLKYPNGAVTWEFEYKDGKWQRRVTDKLPTIYVVCPNEPVAPGKPTVDDLTKLDGPVKVRCTTKPETHTAASFGLIEGTYTIGDVQGNETDGYTCGITVTADKYVEKYNTDFGPHTLTGDNTKTLRLKWDGTEERWTVETPAEFTVECVTTPPTDKPAVPAYNTIKNLTVKVVCPTHSFKDYGVVSAGLTAGKVQEQNGDYFCTVTIKPDAYVNDFNTKLGVEHTPKSEEKSVLLKYVDGAWVPSQSNDSPVIFNVTCTTQEKPTEETIIKDLGNQVVGVVCTTMPNAHGAIYSALREGTFDISDVTTVNGLPSCTITIHAETYVSAFNNSTEVIHQLKYPDVTSKTLQLYYTDGKWTAQKGTTPVVFEVVCPTAPVDAPTEEQIKAELGKIQVKCVTEGSGHAVKEYDTSVGGYTAVTMQDKDGKPIYTVTITVPAQRYIEKYNEETGKTHQLASGEKAEKTVVLKYADKQWTLVEGTLPVVFQVVCENIPAQKYTVTYTDGVDGVEVFKDQVYAGLTAGTATPAFNGTPTRVGYVFAGWDPAVAATVTGNATYAATWKVDSNNNGKPDDEELRYTVTYVDGANGKAFASQVYTGLLSGTATPKFNGTPLRSGYVFIGWSPVWSGTVTGNVTYTATWSTVTGGLDPVPKTGDNGLTLALSALLLFSFCGATACVISTKKRG